MAEVPVLLTEERVEVVVWKHFPEATHFGVKNGSEIYESGANDARVIGAGADYNAAWKDAHRRIVAGEFNPPAIRVLDKFGCAITVGSVLVYGYEIADHAELRIGKVLKIGPKERRYESDSGVKITTWSIEDSHPDRHEGPTLCKAKGVIIYPERTMVVSEMSLPESYRKLLALATLETSFKELSLPERKWVYRQA